MLMVEEMRISAWVFSSSYPISLQRWYVCRTCIVFRLLNFFLDLQVMVICALVLFGLIIRVVFLYFIVLFYLVVRLWRSSVVVLFWLSLVFVILFFVLVVCVP